MGLIVSRYFSRKRTPMEVLEDLEEEIQSLDINRKSTLERQKKIIRTLIMCSFLIFTIFCAVMYLFFPSSTKERMMFIGVFTLFPLSIIILKWIVSWYYMRQISTCKERLSNLKAKKKKILEDVKKNESYNVASEILEKFAPEQLKSQNSGVPANAIVDLNSTATKLGLSVPSSGGDKPLTTPKQLPPSGMRPPTQGSGLPQGVTQRRVGPQMGAPQQTPRLHPSNMNMTPMVQRSMENRAFIRPVPDPNRGFMDKIFEAIVGDGPNRRYALICMNCKTHNGMALEEEFKDIAYRCVYCGFFNPARRPRPKSDSPSPNNSTYSEQDSEDDGGPKKIEAAPSQEALLEEKSEETANETKIEETPAMEVDEPPSEDTADQGAETENVETEDKKIQ